MALPLLLPLLLSSALLHLSSGADFVDDTPIERISFGSCSHQDAEQPLWSEIARWDPDYFIWLGDAVYTDTRVRPFSWKPPSIARYSEQLHKMKTSHDYQSFQKRRTKIVGVWDDHDYGVNDGGASDDIYTAAVQDIFLDFLDEPESSPRRNRRGLYGSYLLGTGEKRVKIILIDPRSQLDKEKQAVLGAEQWAWLDTELRTDPTPFTILGTGLPLLTERIYLDKWLLYPLERERLLSMISRRPNTIIISGDSHFAEIQCTNSTMGPLFEVQSSGMTHNCLDWIPDLLCRYYIKYVSECSGCILEPFIDLNFGTISVMWETPYPRVVLEVRGKSGVALHYLIDVGSVADSDCPPKHYVEHQIIWQLCAVIMLTLVIILMLYITSYISVALFARIVVYIRFTKPHTD